MTGPSIVAEPKGGKIPRALIVDDDRGIRRLLSRVLEGEGIEVHQARDGEDGLRQALSTSYEIVVLDLRLPKVDGMTVLRSLLAARPDQAVIVSSGDSDPQTRGESLTAGARAFLPKPFSLLDLLTTVLYACPGEAARRLSSRRETARPFVQIATRSVESFGPKSSQSSLQTRIADANASLARHPSAVVHSSHAPNEMNLCYWGG